jgi:hypothetical protein
MKIRSRLLRFLSIATTLGLMLARPTPAVACSCVLPDPPPIAFINADAVFAGQVTWIDDPNWLLQYPALLQWLSQWYSPVFSSGSLVKVHMQVANSWKGVSTTSVVVETTSGGASCGYPFSLGGHYVIYAYRSTGALETNICTRTQDAAFATTDLTYLNTLPTLTLTPTTSPPLVWIGASIVITIALITSLSALWWMRRRKTAKPST